jgi:hypothetical protein
MVTIRILGGEHDLAAQCDMRTSAAEAAISFKLYRSLKACSTLTDEKSLKV